MWASCITCSAAAESLRSVVMSDLQQVKSKRHNRDAQNKPVWGELTGTALTSASFCGKAYVSIIIIVVIDVRVAAGHLLEDPTVTETCTNWFGCDKP